MPQRVGHCRRFLDAIRRLFSAQPIAPASTSQHPPVSKLRVGADGSVAVPRWPDAQRYQHRPRRPRATIIFYLAIVGAGLSSNTKEADVANVLGGSVSVISLAYVFHCYFVRGWRRHPNRLLIYRSMSDLVSALAVIGFAVAEGVDTGWGARGSSCSVLAVVFNPGVLLFSFFASEAWGLVLIHDVVRMIRNPMRAPSSATWRDYHLVVWGASLVYTLLALGPGPWEERKWFEPRGDLAVHREIARNCSASCDNHIHLERLPALTRLPTVNTLPVECWRRYRYEDIPGGTFIAFWWILAFNLLSVVFLVYIARQMAASSTTHCARARPRSRATSRRSWSTCRTGRCCIRCACSRCCPSTRRRVRGSTTTATTSAPTRRRCRFSRSSS